MKGWEGLRFEEYCHSEVHHINKHHLVMVYIIAIYEYILMEVGGIGGVITW